MRIYTSDEIIALNPCWLDEEDDESPIRNLVGDGVTLQQVLEYDGLSHSDRIWVAVRLIDREVAITWACDCADRALLREREAGREPDPRSWKAIEYTRGFLRGEVSEEDFREIARKARVVARTMASVTEAGWAKVAGEAAWAAAWAATAAGWAKWLDETACAAAWAAPGPSAASMAERKWQRERLLELANG